MRDAIAAVIQEGRTVRRRGNRPPYALSSREMADAVLGLLRGRDPQPSGDSPPDALASGDRREPLDPDRLSVSQGSRGGERA